MNPYKKQMQMFLQEEKERIVLYHKIKDNFGIFIEKSTHISYIVVLTENGLQEWHIGNIQKI